MPHPSKRRIIPVFHRRYKKIRNREPVAATELETNFLLTTIGSGSTDASTWNMNSSMLDSSTSNVRSSPSMRHLNADGSSGPQLQELLEKVASSSNSKTKTSGGFSVVSKFRIRKRGESHTRMRSDSSMLMSDVGDKNGSMDDLVVGNSSDLQMNAVTLVCKESKRSIYTDESSGGQLQGILEKLMEQDDVKNYETIVSPSKIMEGNTRIQNKTSKESGSKYVKSTKVSFGRIDTAGTSMEDIEDLNPSKTRFEMSDPNEQSKIYLLKRQRQGKKPRRRLPSNSSQNNGSRYMLKNCGVIPELQLSPGSTISMSSCSLDSVLDDPDRLEKYRLLNQPPPSPPPRRNSENTDFIEKPWTEHVLKAVWETYGKVSKFFGCTSL